MPNKKRYRAYFFPLIMTAILVMGFVVNISAVGAVVAIVISAVILCSNVKRASCLLFYFSCFSYILQFGTINLTIFPATAYIVNILYHDVLIRKRLNVRITGICLLVFAYCILFKSSDVGLKLGDLIIPMLLVLVILACKAIKQTDYKEVLDYFINGLIIATIVGSFKFQIPTMGNLFKLDHLYIAGVQTSNDVERFSGLTYDPNFLSLLICTTVAYMLFCYKKFSKFDLYRLVFLVAAGMLTFSKSYILMISALFLLYGLKNAKHIVRTVGLLILLMGGIVLMEYFTDFKIISLILARFEGSKNVNDLTTGRTALWEMYMQYILSDLKVVLLGTGLNGKAFEYAAHSFFIEMVYKFGLVGSTIWLVYFENCFSTLKRAYGRRRRNVFGLMPMLTCLVSIAFLSAYHFHQLWICFVIGFFAMYYREPSKSLEEQK